MIEIPSLRPETRYGIPTADLLLFNREYVVGYSYLFRQPRWALQIIDKNTMPHENDKDFDRLDNFREDLRVPEKFRSTLKDYRGSKHDRGHLINSETFLLSNMSPQKPKFNRGIWKKLEDAVRVQAKKEEFIEVYTICGPLFKIGDKINAIGKNKVVVPDAYFKSILAEKAKPNSTNQLTIWSFEIPNKESNKPLQDFLVPTVETEKRAGLQLWDRLKGEKVKKMESKKGRIWSLK